MAGCMLTSRFNRLAPSRKQECGPDAPAAQRFAWRTNRPVHRDIVATLANDAGRCREKIENEGFNIQKNGGFNLEHAYSTKPRQMRNWYLWLPIAHRILQRLERGRLFGHDPKRLFGSLANLARRLAESFRNVRIPTEALEAAVAARFQIRLNSSRLVESPSSAT